MMVPSHVMLIQAYTVIGSPPHPLHAYNIQNTSATHTLLIKKRFSAFAVTNHGTVLLVFMLSGGLNRHVCCILFEMFICIMHCNL